VGAVGGAAPVLHRVKAKMGWLDWDGSGPTQDCSGPSDEGDARNGVRVP
jgi:hypothetical protein